MSRFLIIEEAECPECKGNRMVAQTLDGFVDYIGVAPCATCYGVGTTRKEIDLKAALDVLGFPECSKC